jgi:hypothetical protein
MTKSSSDNTGSNGLLNSIFHLAISGEPDPLGLDTFE